VELRVKETRQKRAQANEASEGDDVDQIEDPAIFLPEKFAQKGWVGKWIGKGGKPILAPVEASVSTESLGSASAVTG